MAVRDRERARSWGAGHELQAATVELLHAVLAQLARGVPVVMVKKQGRPVEPYRVPRPDWIGEGVQSGGDVKVVSLRELAALMRG